MRSRFPPFMESSCLFYLLQTFSQSGGCAPDPERREKVDPLPVGGRRMSPADASDHWT